MTPEMLIGLIEEAGYKTDQDHSLVVFSVPYHRLLASVADIVAGVEDVGTRIELVAAFKTADWDWSTEPAVNEKCTTVTVEFPFTRPK